MTSPNRQARKSVRLISVELGFTVFIQFLSGIALARILDPRDFGLYGITITVFGLAGLFTDWGAKQRLIQSRNEPDVTTLKIALTSRLILCAVVVPLLWLFSNRIAGIYAQEPQQLSWMIRVYSLVLLFSAVRHNCEISLERNLTYQPLAIVGMLETLFRRGLILMLAVTGAGAWSFIWGNVAAFFFFFAATVAIRQISGAPLGFAFDKQITMDLIRNGLDFRLHLVGGSLRRLATLTLVTRMLGLDAAGYMKWAQDTGGRSMLLVQSATRVALSHFSRLQDDPSRLESVLKRYIYISVVLLGLWFCVLSVAGKDLIQAIYTDKWLPAWEATCVFALGAVLVAIGRFSVSALQGVGRPRFAMVMTFLQAGLTLLLVVFLVPELGIPGAPLGQLAAFAITIPFLVWAIPGVTPALLLRPLTRLLLPLGLALGAGTLMAGTETSMLLRGLMTTGVTTAVYLLGNWFTGPPWLRNIVREEMTLVLGILREADQEKEPGA